MLYDVYGVGMNSFIRSTPVYPSSLIRLLNGGGGAEEEIRLFSKNDIRIVMSSSTVQSEFS